MKKIILSMLVLVFLVQFASAELVVNKFTNEFSLSSTAINGKACSGASQSIPITVDNVGDVAGVFEVEAVSEMDFEVDDDSFHLEPGQSKDTTVHLDIPFGETGTLDYTVVVTSTYGREKRLQRTLVIVKCQNMLVEPITTSQVVDPTELAKFSFSITNPATFQETYEIEAEAFPDYVEFSENEFVLQPGEEKQVFVYSRFPAERWGDFTIPVEIEAQGNGLEQGLDLNLRVQRAYQFGLEVDSSVLACSKVRKEVKVFVENRAGVVNTYDFQVDAPSFVATDIESVALNPGDNHTFTITTMPTDSQTGMRTVTITATSRLGGLEQTREVSIDAQNCYEHDVVMQSSASIICGDETISAKISNNGLYREDYELILNAPQWANLTSTEMTLEPSQQEMVMIEATPPCSDESYEITVTAKNGRLPIERSAATTLNVVTPQTAYQVGLPEKNFDVKYNQKELEIVVEGTGIAGGTYNVSIDSIFLALEENAIKLKPGEEEKITLAIGDLSGFKPGEYLHDLTFSIDGVQYEASIGTDIQRKPLGIIFFGWLYDVAVESQWYFIIGWCGWSTLLLLAVLAIMIAIGVLVKKGNIKTKRFTVDYRTHFEIINLVFIALIILAVVFFLSSFSLNKSVFYEKKSISADPLFHQVKEGHTLTLRMDDYFSDPDEDVLRYSVSGNEHLDIYFENRRAMVRSFPGWAGEEQVVFTATDEAGAAEESEPMTIKVLAKKDLNWVDAWLGNCTEINVLIIALIICALLYLIDKVEPRGRDYYFGRKIPRFRG